MTPQTETSKTIYEGKIVTLKIDEVLIENGKIVKREVIEHAKAACIFAYDDTHCYLVEQYRHPMEQYILEVVAGLCEDGESPSETAMREMNEEIDALCNEVEYLGEFYSSPGFCDEIIYMFAAKISGFKQGTPDDDEFINIKKFTFEELYTMLDQGLIKDGKTIALLYKFKDVHNK